MIKGVDAMIKIKNKFVLTLILALFIVLCLTNCVSADTYTDIEHWAKNYIEYASEKGYFVGVGNGLFNPDGNLTRGMLVTVLYRHSGDSVEDNITNPYTDVNEKDYYYKPVCWANDKKIIFGYEDGEFKPNNPITREEASSIVYRYLNYDNNISENIKFTDIEDISEYAKIPVLKLTENNIVNGYTDGSFKPKQKITRAEACTILSNIDGAKLDVYDVPAKKTKMTYIGTYKLTYYCAGCASTMTASGKRATVDYTVALPRNMWSQWSYYKGKTIYIENIGYRVIEDKCGTNAFDLFCSGGCGSRPFNVTNQKVYLVEE